jgi:TonB-linked SusC/RagA family outer membrane protein
MKKTPNYFWPLKPNVIFHKLLQTVKIVTILLFCGLALPAWSLTAENPSGADQQQIKVSGTVTDGSTNQPMPGVNVLVKGTSNGAITDASGMYTLLGAERNATIVFTFIGYVDQEVAIAGKAIVDVVLAAEVTGLDEVVVVGYSAQKRANVVGSVASISGSTLQQVPSVNVSQSLGGRMAGISVIQQSGEPGQMNPRILVRGRSTLGGDRGTSYGSTNPLIVIDGVQGRSMDEIDPMDVASISVLKDAAASIYGSNAANGVILITTKKGAEGKPRLNYQFYQGFMTPTIIPETTNSTEYATMLSEYQTQNGKARTYTDKDIEIFASGADPWEHPNTNWYKDLIKEWTTTYRHNFTIDGGFKGMTYYLSFGLKGDESMYKQSTTSYKQYNVRAKVDLPINDWLSVGYDVAIFQNNRVYPYKSADGIVGQSTRLLPTRWSFWPTGEPGPDIEYGDNPVVTSTFAGGKNNQTTYRMLNTFNGSIKPSFIKGLSLNGSFSYDLTNYYAKAFYQPWTLYTPNWGLATRDATTGFITAMPLTPGLRGLSSPQNNETYSRTNNQTININAVYAKKFGDHNISLYGGFEQYTSNWNELYGFRQYYISTLIQTMNAGADQDKNTSGSASIYARKSWIGRATYDYKGKYLAEILFRRDGSLKFPPESRWGNFPGLLLGWRVSEEGFWKDNIAFINYFKLRGSYGKMGMDPGNPFQYTNSFGLGSGMVFGTGTSIETAVGPPVIANPNITWETQTTQNLGFESKFANDLFHLNFEVFYNKREQILAPRDASVPAFSGLTLPNENIAQVDNKGFEVDAGIHKSITSDFRIDLSANYSYNHNNVVYQDEPIRAVPWQQTTGHPYNAWLMYNAIGIFKDDAQLHNADGTTNTPHWSTAKPGDVIFEDYNKDGIIDGNDRILIDEVDAPNTYYGVNLDASFKDFTLSVLVQGQGKYLRNKNYDNRRGEAGNYMKWAYDNRWTPTNTVTDIARAYNRDDYYWSPDVQMSTYWLSNVAYCRLKSLVLTYNIPSSLYSKLGIAKASVYVSGNNLALIYSAEKIWDPEALNPGVYPTMKTFAIGANIAF